jgi:hypothetical protein
MKTRPSQFLLAALAACSLAVPATAADPAPAPEPATPESTTPEPAAPEPATPEPAAPEPAAPEPATPEPAAPKPSAEATPASEASNEPDTKDGKDGKKKDKKDKKDKDKKDKDKDGDKKDKKNDGDQDQNGGEDGKKDGKKDADQGASEDAEPAPGKSNDGDWCEWLSDEPGLLYEDKKNPWFQSFNVGGRFQYQAAYQDGSDMHGRDYHDTYDEYRRFRLETKTKFLKYFTTTLDLNLVDDRRFREGPDNELDWGYDDFDTATLEFNLGKYLDLDALDSLKLAYGRMKMPVTEEQRQSSREIYTIERSLLSDKLGGEESRPTGFTVELEKGDWSGTIGIFSGEDDADFIGGWNDGITQFYSLTWQPDGDFHLTLDYVTTHQSGSDDALGYQSAVALGSTYDKKRWGAQASVMYGDNGYGDPTDNDRNRANRQGDFYGVTVMPWYWLVKDRLQLVTRFEYARAEESEGLQLASRYIRGHHDDPLVDVNNGRGSRYNAWYLGLNYYLCGDNAKIMAGVMYENLAASTTVKIDRPRRLGGDYYVPDRGTVDAFTYVIAFRAAF